MSFLQPSTFTEKQVHHKKIDSEEVCFFHVNFTLFVLPRYTFYSVCSSAV